ncbi:MAG TPA: lipid-binding SYLF domain-containing protein [Terriglobales bacterium]|nr:lipid-binding SYLF domain-containing protein [Terriglobales bacterium]
MKKLSVVTIVVVSMALCAAASDRRGATLDRVQTSSTILNQIMSAPDKAIPDGIMNGAKCIAIVPSDLKASFIFGANYGKGVATCRTEHGWSAPVFFKVTGGSFGFQAGGQASDLVLIIRTDDGMQHLLQSKFKVGGDASAAAGPVGRDAQASTDLTMRAQILTYSRSRGLFLGVSLSGAVIHQDDADTHAFYGQTWTFYSLLKGEVAAPKDAQGLLNTVEKYAPTPRVRAQATPTAASPTSTASPAVTAAPVATATPATAVTATPTLAAAPVETPEAMPDPTTETTPDTTPSPATTTAPAPEPSSSSLAPNNASGHR